MIFLQRLSGCKVSLVVEVVIIETNVVRTSVLINHEPHLPICKGIMPPMNNGKISNAVSRSDSYLVSTEKVPRAYPALVLGINDRNTV